MQEFVGLVIFCHCRDRRQQDWCVAEAEGQQSLTHRVKPLLEDLPQRRTDCPILPCIQHSPSPAPPEPKPAGNGKELTGR